MTAKDPSALSAEWQTLQNNYEQYEQRALSIKLVAVVVCAGTATLSLSLTMAILLLSVLWLQEGIFRTGQARLGARILRIERILVQGKVSDMPSCQLHSEWLAARPGTVGLAAEYLMHAVRPTVAFPYAVLILAELVRNARM